MSNKLKKHPADKYFKPKNWCRCCGKMGVELHPKSHIIPISLQKKVKKWNKDLILGSLDFKETCEINPKDKRKHFVRANIWCKTCEQQSGDKEDREFAELLDKLWENPSNTIRLSNIEIKKIQKFVRSVMVRLLLSMNFGTVKLYDKFYRRPDLTQLPIIAATIKTPMLFPVMSHTINKTDARSVVMVLGNIVLISFFKFMPNQKNCLPGFKRLDKNSGVELEDVSTELGSPLMKYIVELINDQDLK